MAVDLLKRDAFRLGFQFLTENERLIVLIGPFQNRLSTDSSSGLFCFVSSLNISETSSCVSVGVD